MSQKVIASTISNVGFGGTKDKNEFGVTKSIIFTSPSFSFASSALAATKAGYVTATRNKTLFPMPETWRVEDMSADPIYATSESGKKKKMRKRIKELKVSFDVPMDSHIAMQTFDNQDLNVILVDENNNFRFYKNSTVFQGFSLSMLNTEEMTEVPVGSDAPAISAVILQLDNIDEWNKYGTSIKPSWLATTLKPLTNVYLEQVGEASATSLTVRVYSDGGYDSAGAVVKVGIKGLVKADFTATTGAGADQTAAFTGAMTDNEDGTYTFIATGLVSGTVNLVSASALADGNDLYDSHFGSSDGEATLTVT